MQRKCAFAAIVVMALARLVAAEEEPLFTFVISYDSPSNITNVSDWLAAPAGKNGFIGNDGGHLADDAGRIRIWGVNLAFDACTPERDQAKRLAARLARLGVNCVRIHHIDNRTIWGKSPNKLAIDPKVLDRLDYLIHQLKRRGIYTNLNLHVSRSLGFAEGFPDPDRRPPFDKGVDNFDPRMIELQKKYARDLLTHVNPYTKTAYADEPAVAFVEISNEDALFAVWQAGQLEALPEPYSTVLRISWNGWLREKYKNTEKLRATWGDGASTDLGDEMLANVDLAGPVENTWRLDGDGAMQVELSILHNKPTPTGRAMRLVVVKPGTASWAPLLIQPGVSLKKGESYTLSFRIRSDSANECNVACQKDHSPWNQIGLESRVKLSPHWMCRRYCFVAADDEPNARIAFGGFLTGAMYEFADVSLRPGGIVGLDAKQRIEDDAVPIVASQSAAKGAAGRDFCDFLWILEQKYWNEMYRFLKDDLHVRSLVCGTQLGYSPMHVQASLDYVDHHSYWKHPEFPNRPWDMKDWYIENAAMADQPGGTLARLASGRVLGKPYTISEYNHPAPNSYLAEGFPMIAAFAAFQAWDGVYAFAYSHNRNFEPRKIEGFFDIKSNTAQLAHFPACAAMFLRGDVSPSAQPAVFRFTRDDERRQLHRRSSAWNLTADELARDLKQSLLHGVAIDLSARDEKTSENDASTDDGNETLPAGRYVSDTGEICWDNSQKNAGYFTVGAKKSKLFTGFVRARSFDLGGVTLKIEKTRLDWATISMTVIEGDGFDRPCRILLAATGLVQNRNAFPKRLSQDRVTLRDQWGVEPVLCEGIAAAITLPVASNRVKCYPLDESGNRRETISAKTAGNPAQIEIDPKYKTVWYEIEIESDK